jgi:hypothetical protein
VRGSERELRLQAARSKPSASCSVPSERYSENTEVVPSLPAKANRPDRLDSQRFAP